jgi:hypothetical protein
VENDIIVVAILGMRDEVLNCLGGGFGKQPDCNVAVCCVYGGGGTGGG